jgi:uncharacterized protein YgiM (DUF1202 family)
MKQLYLYLFAIIFIISSCVTTPVPTSNYSTLQKEFVSQYNDVSIRSQPKSSSSTFKRINQGEKIFVTRQYNSEWYIVQIDGKDYYALVSSLIPAEQYNPNTTVKTEPSTITPSYSSPSRNIETGSRGGHYYINSKGNKTYIKKK